MEPARSKIVAGLMVDRAEILDVAKRQSLGPQVVEKDLALGWVLAGISAHPALRDTWVFKGGTCLKKCYFETYRFSEDLDFTLLDAGHLDDAFLKATFEEIGQWVYERSGIEMPSAEQRFDIYRNPRGNLSCEGKLGYLGPVSPRTRTSNWPRLKLDLTADERVVLPPVRRDVFHPYSDAPEEGIDVLCYAFEEAFAEKVRALGERTRPRDLYDVINLFRLEDMRPTAPVLRDVLRQKCDFKGIAAPRYADVTAHEESLRAGWSDMLAHQLPALPSVDNFWSVLPDFFAWLESGILAAAPAALALGEGDVLLRSRRLNLSMGIDAESYMEIIRFAAANRLLVELDYQNGTRRIEPYSLRQSRAGDILLEAHNVDKDEHRSYRVDRIQGARIRSETFAPRYAIELSPVGQLDAPPIVRPARTPQYGAIPSSTRRVAVAKPRRAAAPKAYGTGPVHIFKCPVCGKTFRKKTWDATLNKHKGKNGYDCYGSFGTFVRTEW